MWSKSSQVACEIVGLSDIPAYTSGPPLCFMRRRLGRLIKLALLTHLWALRLLLQDHENEAGREGACLR